MSKNFRSGFKNASIISSIAALVLTAFVLTIDFGAGQNDYLTREEFTKYKMEKRDGDTSRKPSDWFMLSRSYPYDRIPFQSYKRALDRAVELKNANAIDVEFTAEPAGPTNVGGRITAIAVHPDDQDIIYAGAALGGILKSTDGGDSWTPVSDAVPSLSVGDIAMDPANPEVLYFGTGEANSSGDSYAGTGVYKTTDGGDSWEFIGLPDSRHIGRIAIDPLFNNRVYVAAMGSLFNTNPERGLYRSTDYGESWEQVLYISDSTGVIDVVIDPDDTDILYAAAWQRIRNPVYRHVGGVETGIYKSTDGGDSWELLSNGLPEPHEDNGRIGLAIAGSDPDIVYASYVNHPGNMMGIWRTTNSGDSWESRLVYPDTSDFSGFGWYFGQIWVHPNDPDLVYLGDVDMWRSSNGGRNWSSIIGSMHVDMHALYQDPNDPSYMVCGNDGGIYISTNTGGSWRKSYDLPITQFYAITIDQQLPHRLYGGTQDNSTPGTIVGEPDEWEVFFYGDGFYTNVDYTNSNVIYAEAQYGYLGKSTNLGSNWDVIFGSWEHNERSNWSTPVVMSPFDNRTLYYGAERIWRTTNGGNSFSAISPDLTGGPGGGNLVFGTITTISPSTLMEDIIWAGTDDSRVWITTDGGNNWDMVSEDLPERWCTRVTADVFDPACAYVSFSGYKEDDLMPHIFKTTDYGATWNDISGNLGNIPVNDILPDPRNQNRLYIGTDFGVYYTDDGGTTWSWMGDGHPICPVFDLELHDDERILVSGTHGRSMYVFDISATDIPEDENNKPIATFQLHSNYPNPFNSSTTVTFDAGTSADIELNVYDINGRLVRELMDRRVTPGTYSVRFDAEDLASGTYFITLRSGESSQTIKASYIK
ncbi:MAG: T9SS type A sorting domain-containing protein [candidate division Zixibacteria bacterium]|nr:T9SS type A sorting domain-containing protein [candidate division Zixibacteria bacterium]